MHRRISSSCCSRRPGTARALACAVPSLTFAGLVTGCCHPRGMRQEHPGAGGVTDGAAPRRRERTRPARNCVLKVYLSVEERDLIRAGAAAVRLTPTGFVARAAVDAAVVKAAPVGARSALELLAGLQLELVALRRRLDLLRADLATDAAADGEARSDSDTLRRCSEAADQLIGVSRAIHRQLGGGF